MGIWAARTGAENFHVLEDDYERQGPTRHLLDTLLESIYFPQSRARHLYISSIVLIYIYIQMLMFIPCYRFALRSGIRG